MMQHIMVIDSTEERGNITVDNKIYLPTSPRVGTYAARRKMIGATYQEPLFHRMEIGRNIYDGPYPYQ